MSKAESNRANGQHSTGPRTPEGKARTSANALKIGFLANVERLNPADSPAYQDAVEDMRMGLHPDGPVEEQLIRELAMFRARLLRLESAEYALLCADMETNTGDAREVAAYLNNSDALEKLQKAEVHLRRAYNRTWDHLERRQKERHKMPLDESLKQTQRWATYCSEMENRPKRPRESVGPDQGSEPTGESVVPHPEPGPKSRQQVPHPAIDDSGNLFTDANNHPQHQPETKDGE